MGGPGTVVHAKVVVADDLVSFGTVNLDAWALYRNSEIMMLARSAPLAALMEERLFAPDVARQRVTGSRAGSAPGSGTTCEPTRRVSFVDARQTAPNHGPSLRSATVYRNILVAIDGSPPAARALRHAGELAQALHARLTVMSVVPSIPGYAYAAGVDVAALEREAERQTDTGLREALASLPADVSVTSFLRHGDAEHEIVDALDEGDYDLIVLGSRGRGRVTSTLFGSVGAAVHFHAHVPMLIVHPVAGDDG